VDAFRVADLMTAEAKINAILDGAIKPMCSLSLAWAAIELLLARRGQVDGSTLRGFEVATLAPGGALAGHRTLSWEADERGGGRNARQRLTFDGRHAFGPLYAPVPPARWG
jgi:hypothetical protein